MQPVNRSEVTMEEFEEGKDKILMGAERKTMVMSEKEKENTAYHEAGHAIVGRLCPSTIRSTKYLSFLVAGLVVCSG